MNLITSLDSDRLRNLTYVKLTHPSLQIYLRTDTSLTKTFTEVSRGLTSRLLYRNVLLNKRR